MIAIDGNLRRQFLAALPDKAPLDPLVDIPAAEADRFDAFVHARAPRATLERVPMLRGRIVAREGVAAENLKPSPDTTGGARRAIAASPMATRSRPDRA